MVQKTTHKYGIEVPTTINQARLIDEKNGNTFWHDAIEKDMITILPALDILSSGDPPPICYIKTSVYLVFDVKMDFTRKARWVKDGHLTPNPVDSNFAGGVSRENVRITLIYAALNDLDIFAADVKSAYLQVPTSEKHFIICGSEFPIEFQGKIGVIKRALYGGKYAGCDYWKQMRTCMEHMKLESCKADPDV